MSANECLRIDLRAVYYVAGQAEQPKFGHAHVCGEHRADDGGSPPGPARVINNACGGRPENVQAFGSGVKAYTTHAGGPPQGLASLSATGSPTQDLWLSL
ncbi:hypothetical protein HYPSUDRAFT_206373 [Hypholoma sublateritium FD-334 SS-4]|uniref:Uncharacterized protein n=1 Tax=Hypholoma sublateritium (strain FD-334 SS-4) TaxID=945553 RepID=A0A0D2M266_HYPSF|nr:hypothetical protein HYPSUDRAFT_206373 [Hypholoma sublateritium FD-334 SS-4]